MIHKLCTQCVRTCKQSSSVKIVKCPRFEKRLSEQDFRRMVNDVTDIEKQADDLKGRIRSLLDTMRDDPSPIDGD